MTEGYAGTAPNQYYNTYQWSEVTDFSTTYVKFAISDTDLAKLSGKSTIGITTKLASNGSVLTKAMIAFFNDEGQIGTNCEVTLNGSTQIDVDKDSCNVAFTNTTGLHVRIIGYNDVAATKSAALRVYPITISAK